MFFLFVNCTQNHTIIEVCFLNYVCKSCSLTFFFLFFSQTNRSPKDLYYDQEYADKERKLEESKKQAQAKRTSKL